MFFYCFMKKNKKGPKIKGKKEKEKLMEHKAL